MTIITDEIQNQIKSGASSLRTYAITSEDWTILGTRSKKWGAWCILAKICKTSLGSIYIRSWFNTSSTAYFTKRFSSASIFIYDFGIEFLTSYILLSSILLTASRSLTLRTISVLKGFVVYCYIWVFYYIKLEEQHSIFIILDSWIIHS